MKSGVTLFAVGDPHCGNLAPSCRDADDYLLVCLRKMSFFFEKIHQCEKGYGLVPGDLWDNWRNDSDVLNPVLDLNWPCAAGHLVFAVPGQHDLPGHNISSIHRSSFQTLLLSGKIQFSGGSRLIRDVRFDWCLSMYAWKQPWSRLLRNPPTRNVILAHKPTWLKPISPGQKPDHAVALLDKYPHCQLMVLGDNHAGFMVQQQSDGKYESYHTANIKDGTSFPFGDGERYLLNPGSLMRITRAQTGHVPGYFEINSKEIVWHVLPITDAILNRVRVKGDEDPVADSNTTDFVKQLTSLTTNKPMHLKVSEVAERFAKKSPLRTEVYEFLALALNADPKEKRVYSQTEDL